MGATRSTMDAALKDLYLPNMRSVINISTVLLSRLDARTDMTSVSGRQATFPVNIRGTQAIGARADGGLLPTAQNQTYVESAVPYRYLYGTVSFTHPTIATTRDKRGAWVRVASAEMDGLTRDIKWDVNRQYFGWGCGVLGTANGPGSPSTTLTMDAGHQVKTGMYIDVWTDINGSDTLQVDGVLVTAVTSTTATITSSTWSDNAYVTRKGVLTATASTPTFYEMMGLMGIVDDYSKTSGIGAFCQTLQGIDRNSYTEWNANVMENSTANTGRPISAVLLDEAVMKAPETSGEKPTIGITSPLQWRRIGDLLVGDRRYTDAMDLEGGFTAIKWAGVPITWDKDCPMDINGNDMLFLLAENCLSRYQLADWDWDDYDGNVLHRNQGYATYDGTLFYYGNLGTDNPAAHTVVRDLSRS